VAVSSAVSFLTGGADSVGVVDQKSISLAPGLTPNGLALTAVGSSDARHRFTRWAGRLMLAGPWLDWRE